MAEEQQSHLIITQSDGVNIVKFADRRILEELSITEIGKELSRLIHGSSEIKLLLSFVDVEHLSSAALGMLIQLNNEVQEQAGKLKLSDITPQIYEVFKITRLNRLFDIYDTKEEALASF